ncbi:MAG: YlmC/YmxH family sporulation protein [Clostridiales bacterium]|nr:YlmC/YmxH family sporulation protein [Clostridiales bacterium]MBQ9931868.1 YlmC/YmxH family sporulation protein [Bacillota bacterium]
MRLSELGNREIIDLTGGNRYGDLDLAELIFEEEGGAVKVLMVPELRKKFALFSGTNFVQIPFSAVKKIGADIILVET